MERIIFGLGNWPVNVEMAALGAFILIAFLLVLVLLVLLRSAKKRRLESEESIKNTKELERHLAGVLQVQSEMTGRMQTMSEIFGTRTSDLSRILTDKIDSANTRMGHHLNESRVKTERSLSKLTERLAVIDRAQSTITELSGEIVSLQSILSNKQQRGAFGQGRMEAIIADGLAGNTYSFQATLSNSSRPDCLIHMPNDAPDLVIDAKFPLEAWQRINDAKTPEEVKQANSSFKNDVGVHVKAISEKYLIPGETQDTAFMFVPSESIFADLHEHFGDVVQKAVRARVVIVSPSLLMLSIQVIQALLRDVRMREQAHLIQKEARLLMEDIGRLDERVIKLQTHFSQASKDIEMIVTSSSKVARRSDRIEAMEFDNEKVKLSEDEGE